jgi:hypothetical protein
VDSYGGLSLYSPIAIADDAAPINNAFDGGWMWVLGVSTMELLSAGYRKRRIGWVQELNLRE